MRSVRYAVIDAFTDIPYRGNPAAVLLLEETKDTEWMQRVATEFNLSQTAFLRKRPPAPSRENGSALENCEEFDLRWFTPIIEVDLCGHATVAAAHFLFSSGFVKCNYVFFHTRSGILTAVKVEGFQQKRNAKSFARRVTEEFAVELNFPQTAVLDCDSLEIPSLSSTLDGLAVNGVKKTASGDILVIFRVPNFCCHTYVGAHKQNRSKSNCDGASTLFLSIECLMLFSMSFMKIQSQDYQGVQVRV